MTGEGVDDLLAHVEARISGAITAITVSLTPAQMPLLDWVYRHGDVTERADNDDGSVTMTVRATDAARREISERLALGDSE